MNFNKITVAEEKAAVNKFREYGIGVNMSKFANVINTEAVKWEDLINPVKFSPRSIKTKMYEVARVINTSCNDELLGNADVAFSHVTEREERIDYTWEDIYKFLRAAYRYQIETADYRNRKAEVAKLEQFLEDNKTLTEKREEAKSRLKELQKQL